MLLSNVSANVAEQLGLDPYPLTPPIATDTGYDMIKDPFAVVSFILLVFTIFAFLFILIITARRSANEIWDSIHRESEQRRRMRDLEGVPEDAIPLIGSAKRENVVAGKVENAKTKEKEKARAKQKYVRFSEIFDFVAVPAPHPCEDLYEKCRRLQLNTDRPYTRELT